MIAPKPLMKHLVKPLNVSIKYTLLYVDKTRKEELKRKIGNLKIEMSFYKLL